MLFDEIFLYWQVKEACFEHSHHGAEMSLKLFEVKDCSGVYSLHIGNHTFNPYESFKSALATFEKVIELKVHTSFRKVGAYIGLTHAKRIRSQTLLRSSTIFPWYAYIIDSQLRRPQKTLRA